jgi:hypothetical protein
VDDFSARLKPGAKRILMNTRWHEEDVAGRVLEQIERKLIKGRVISIPAIAEENDPLGRKPGEYLWDEPDGYNYGAFLRDRQLVQSFKPTDIDGSEDREINLTLGEHTMSFKGQPYLVH